MYQHTCNEHFPSRMLHHSNHDQGTQLDYMECHVLYRMGCWVQSLQANTHDLSQRSGKMMMLAQYVYKSDELLVLADCDPLKNAT